jgi:hypothetical protein
VTAFFFIAKQSHRGKGEGEKESRRDLLGIYIEFCPGYLPFMGNDDGYIPGAGHD